MVDVSKGAKLVVETCMGVKPGQTVLVLVDHYAKPMRIGQAVMEAVFAVNAEAVMAVMRPSSNSAAEPPRPVAAAMKAVDKVLYITDKFGLGHTNARKEASAAGVRYYVMAEITEDELNRDLTKADMMLLRDNTEKVAKLLTKAKSVKVTSAAGTNITMSLEGREGLALHPLSNLICPVPDYAEATIAPVEGTAEGVIVVDAEMIGWGYLFREPLRLSVKAGRVVDISGPQVEAERLRRTMAIDENANNIAEFAIGTSHIMPTTLRGTRRDAGIAGMLHIALGRSDGIGGTTKSGVHIDSVLTRASVELDGKQVVRDGVIQV